MTDLQTQGDNSDFCACCGGHGELLCCDGCPLSFHFTCTDPPQDTANPPEKEWYCSHCRAKRAPPPKYAPGIFCALKTEMHSKDTVSYILPFDVRDYFHGVKTGEEGEYEEEVTTKTKYVPHPCSLELAPSLTNADCKSGPKLATKKYQITSS